MLILKQELVHKKIWLELSKQNIPSLCKCSCGETFLSLSYYIGKKTGTVTEHCCPQCGSWDLECTPQILKRER